MSSVEEDQSSVTDPEEYLTPTSPHETGAAEASGRGGARAVYWVLGALSVGLLAVAVWSLRFGFDFTDESYYVIWLRDPGRYPISVTQFGFLWHPLYLLVDGNLWLLRVINLLFVFGLSWSLAYRVISSSRALRAPSQDSAWAVSLGLASGSVALLAVWLPSPSYNSLNLIGLLVVAVGTTYADRDVSIPGAFGWFLIALGGWIVLMAKPTTAVALIPILLAFLLVTRRFSVRLALAGAAASVAMVMVTGLVIDGSVADFLSRLGVGKEMADALLPGRSLGRIVEQFLFTGVPGSLRVTLAVLTVLTVALAAVTLAFFVKGRQRLLLVLITGGALGLVLLGAFLLSGVRNLPWSYLLLVPGLAAALAGLVVSRREGSRAVGVDPIATACFLGLLPFLFAFGTANPTWWVAAFASVLFPIAGTALLSRYSGLSARMLAMSPIVAATIALSTLVLLGSLSSPYRQPGPVISNSEHVELGPEGSSLILSGEAAQYVEALRSAAAQGGWQPGTAMVDLTGKSPGALLVLDAVSLGQPWLLGGYTGSEAFATESLRQESCETLSRAWLLVAPGTPRALPEGVPLSFGARIDQDYEIVGDVESVDGAQQQLLRPKDDGEGLREACEAARAS